jgi:hypothetical protein
MDCVLVIGNGERLRDNTHEFQYHRQVLILKRQMRLKGQHDLNFLDRYNQNVHTLPPS